MSSSHPPCRLAPWDPRRAHIRLACALLLGTLAALLFPTKLDWHFRGLIGWDVGALTILILAWSVILPSDAQETHANAAVEDPGRAMVWILALGSSFYSFFAALFELRALKDHSGVSYQSLLAILAVLLSWLVTHTSYTLRYARLYYRNKASGLVFPGEERPCDIDFAYFSFTIGMCFQVSDVLITSSQIRRLVLGHALLSFIYNTCIVAMTLNVALDFLH